PYLDERIRATYAERSTATLKNALYDSYIRAIRWASDRVGDSGVIGFVTNAGWLEANTADGLRRCLAEEFSSIYVFHLRGNQRTSGEISRKEGGKIFGSGSRAPIAISLLVKNPQAAEHGQIYFHDIGDYLTREEKLERIAAFGSINGITAWQDITPDLHGDWLNQRDESFNAFIVMGNNRANDNALFDKYSRGQETGRDAWVYNSSQQKLRSNVEAMIAVYNEELLRFNATHAEIEKKVRESTLDGFINMDPKKISWTSSLKQNFVHSRPISFSISALTPSMYRPFFKQWVYYDSSLIHRVGQMPRIFPDRDAKNLLIMVKQRPGPIGQIAFMMDCPPELQTDGGSQCFPLYLYDETAPQSDDSDLFSEPGDTAQRRRDAISDEGLAHFRQAYCDEDITKESIFYYIYRILHSQGFREKYADNLSKELPRIPRVKTPPDFWAFSKAGRS